VIIQYEHIETVRRVIHARLDTYRTYQADEIEWRATVERCAAEIVKALTAREMDGQRALDWRAPMSDSLWLEEEAMRRAK
jgi:hypothetical protein